MSSRTKKDKADQVAETVVETNTSAENQKILKQNTESPPKEEAEKKKIKKDKDKLDKKLMESTLCKLVKKDFLDDHFDSYEILVGQPAYICSKCGRAAKHKASLCKPVKIGKHKK